MLGTLDAHEGRVLKKLWAKFESVQQAWVSVDASLGVVSWPPDVDLVDLEVLQLDAELQESGVNVPEVMAPMDVDGAAATTAAATAGGESTAEVEDLLDSAATTAAQAATTTATEQSGVAEDEVREVAATTTAAAVAGEELEDGELEKPLFLGGSDEDEDVVAPVSGPKVVPGDGHGGDAGNGPPVMKPLWDVAKELKAKKKRMIAEVVEAGSSGSERDSDEDHGKGKRQRVQRGKERKEKKGKGVAKNVRQESVSLMLFV